MFRRTKTKFEKKDDEPTDDDAQKSAKNEITAGFGKFLGKKKDQDSENNSLKTENDSSEGKTKSSQTASVGENKVSALIRLIRSSKEKTIAPQLDLSTGVFTFPQLSAIGEDPNNIQFLENLTHDSDDLLEKVVHERIAVCPQHPDSLQANVRLYCPKCSSMDIEKLHLFEHRVCGYISETKNFSLHDSVLECPSCKKPIKDRKKELRIPAMWYNCHSCKEKFDDVVIKMYCRKFDHDFDTNMAGTVSIPGFVLKDSQSSSDHDSSLISDIKNLLQEYQFTSEDDHSLKGKSGHYHNIDLIATNPNTDTIFLYVLQSANQIDESGINSKIIQVLDCNPTKTIMIGNLTEKAKTMASRYDISIINSFEKEHVLSSLKNIINDTFTIEKTGNNSSDTETINYLEPENSEESDHHPDAKLLEENVAKAAELEEENSKLREKLENEKLAERKKLEEARLAAEKIESERLSERKKLEEERLEAEKIEAARLEAELRAEKQRLEKEMQESKQKLEEEVLADKQKLEQERERLEEERREAERIEAERLAERKRLEEERKKVERIEAERLAERKKLEAEILSQRKKIEAERLAERKKLEEERFADQLKLKAEHQRLETERKKVEQLEIERQRLEEERKRAELLAAEKLEAEEKRKAEDKRQAEKRAKILKKLEETENQLKALKSSFDSDDEEGE